MKKVDDGGQAFPVGFDSSYLSGMSLRDYFAAKAMQALIIAAQSNNFQLAKHVPEGTLLVPAREGAPLLAYEYADNMLEARK
jgi:hypothetical protein